MSIALGLGVVVGSGNLQAADSTEPLDRHALVTRHNIEWNDPDGQIPLGNGEFCFNADATGLQTFGGSTLSHWAWHSAPLPPGIKPGDVPATGTMAVGRLGIEMAKAPATKHPELHTMDWGWMFKNPHPINLARLRLVRANGVALEPHEISNMTRRFNLWTGLHQSRFTVDGQTVEVETCVHPERDLVAIRADSALLRDGKLMIVVDFPYPAAIDGQWAGDWNRPEAHRSELRPGPSGGDAIIRRTADASMYQVSANWSAGGTLSKWPTEAGWEHSFMLTAGKDGPLELVLEFVCGFPAEASRALPKVEQTQQAAAEHWKNFWSTGGTIDLSQSTDPRWKELERRIVLSQYHTAAQSAGSWPPAEIGLMGIDYWSSQFHMEMTWWHLAHYGLWDRWQMADRSMGCYQKFLSVARQLAKQFDYMGAKWGKQVGPEGRSAPWEIVFLLQWQQPHPIFFAELEYRLRPTQATLEKWRDVIFATADYMADFPTRDDKGIYNLAPVWAACEDNGLGTNTVFETAYWRFGLGKAQAWRERLGLSREPKWDEVLNHLAPLPENDGVYVLSPEFPDIQGTSHADAIGVYGMLPLMQGVDPKTAHRTVLKVWQTYDWERCWGWDFPWVAMAAARTGEPGIAVEALLHASSKNHYDRRGVCAGGMQYLPGNGGLLYAAAMMAAGWDGGPETHAPGFPPDGSWVVKWEGLKSAP